MCWSYSVQHQCRFLRHTVEQSNYRVISHSVKYIIQCNHNQPSDQQGTPTANWCTGPVVSMKNPWHSLAWFCQKCWHLSYDQSSTTLIHCQVSPSFFLWESCENGWECRQQPSHLSLLLRAGDVHLGGHILPGWRPSKVISLHWIWSCMKPENWLRIDLSGDWCLCIALCTRNSTCYYWIGITNRTDIIDTYKTHSQLNSK